MAAFMLILLGVAGELPVTRLYGGGPNVGRTVAVISLLGPAGHPGGRDPAAWPRRRARHAGRRAMRMLLATLARLEGSADGPRYRAGLAERLQIVAVPPAGAIRPSSIRSMVVLPAPFGPRNPVTVPAPGTEAHIVNRQHRPETLGQPAYLDHAHRAASGVLPRPGGDGCVRSAVMTQARRGT
jgi:hypothetical protein